MHCVQQPPRQGLHWLLHNWPALPIPAARPGTKRAAMMQGGSHAGCARVRCNRPSWAPWQHGALPLTAVQAPRRQACRLVNSTAQQTSGMAALQCTPQDRNEAYHLHVCKHAGTSSLQSATPRVRPSRSAPCSASMAVPPVAATASLISPVRSAQSASGTPYAEPPCTLWPTLPPDRPAHQGRPRSAARPPILEYLCVIVEAVVQTIWCIMKGTAHAPAVLPECMHRHSM